jgi:hypothetical protein
MDLFGDQGPVRDSPLSERSTNAKSAEREIISDAYPAIFVVHVDADDGFSCDAAFDLRGPHLPQVTPCDPHQNHEGVSPIFNVRLPARQSLNLRRLMLNFLIDFNSPADEYMASYLDKLGDAVYEVLGKGYGYK